VAFEDQGREKLKAILAEWYMYLFSNRATVKKWKYHCPNSNNKDTSPMNISKHSQADASSNKDAAPPNTPDTLLTYHKKLHT
jgi:hypothetical protein